MATPPTPGPMTAEMLARRQAALAMPTPLPSSLPPPPPPAPVPARQSGTYAGLSVIREAMTYFRWALVLIALTSLIYAAAIPSLGVGSVVGVPGHPPTLDNASVRSLLNRSAGLQGVSLLAGGVALVGLALELVSYLKWREGLKTVERYGFEYGARHLGEVRSAQSDRRTAFAVFLVQLVVSTIVVLAMVAIFFQVFQAQLPGGVPLTPDQRAGFQQELSALFIATVLLSVLFSVLLYFFASRSLGRAIRELVPTGTGSLLRQGVILMLVGAVLPLLGAFELAYTNLAYVGAVWPIVTAVGLTRIIQAYDLYLSNPGALTPIGSGSLSTG
ncbi:MAG: hypothetical protein L3K19_09605 [Thermoplasmata archaeon]|nr:hypothetical protein [Thermoplasmata archaeon]